MLTQLLVCGLCVIGMVAVHVRHRRPRENHLQAYKRLVKPVAVSPQRAESARIDRLLAEAHDRKVARRAGPLTAAVVKVIDEHHERLTARRLQERLAKERAALNNAFSYEQDLERAKLAAHHPNIPQLPRGALVTRKI